MPHVVIAHLHNKKVLRIAGMMSGTSADGVDVAFVELSARGVKTLAFDMLEYPRRLRERVFGLFDPATSSVDAICTMNFALGAFFGHALVTLARKHGLELAELDAVGSHGQTIWHEPAGVAAATLGLPREAARRLGGPVRSTLQIGEPSVIARMSGLPVVADFRPADIAAGGQGAPLVPFADLVLFGLEGKARALQNIGGIANVTYLPPLEKPTPSAAAARSGARRFCGRSVAALAQAAGGVVAFDTGPGNMIMDRIVWRMTGRRQGFDRGGRLAAKGHVDDSLLAELLRHNYFGRRPPKTSGREVFGAAYTDAQYARATGRGLAPADVLATATAFTARTIAEAYRRFLPPVDEVIVCGGGARNATLLDLLQRELAPARVLAMDALGVSADAKEAISFAILAAATLKGFPANVPAATGASRPAILGNIVLP